MQRGDAVERRQDGEGGNRTGLMRCEDQWVIGAVKGIGALAFTPHSNPLPQGERGQDGSGDL